MLHQELKERAEPEWKEIIEHPFWTGVRDGSLPPGALTHFVEQCAGHVLPAYARALARTAAATRWDRHVVLLAQAAAGTVRARDRLLAAHNGLDAALGVPRADPKAPAGAITHAHTTFLHAATATTVAAGMGGLLPLAWFRQRIGDDLRQRRVPGARHNVWIDIFHPGPEYAGTVSELEGVYDELGGLMATPGRTELVEYFMLGLRYTASVTKAAWAEAGQPTAR
ncbi:TenA family transcriptional regulator [Streptomyces chrestomyceticus]|uniref:TenA family transcriptional regulator n=1 Tax=Streptomyces chrestomyceticus TaxID=68185 RepID=A0ABU7WUC5_9ACTN